MDPQQRLLMEVVYDSLCAAGLPIEKLRGSDTAVYVGSMCDDYNTMLYRDWETLPRYTSTGTERGILANRLSYFFDWHGPSLSIDTACSSSMVSLDHAVQTVRRGTTRVAVAAGTSLLLSPGKCHTDFGLAIASIIGTSIPCIKVFQLMNVYQLCTFLRAILVCYRQLVVVLCGMWQQTAIREAKEWQPW